MQHGTFIISLDFELYWGIVDHVPLAKYEENLRGVPQAIQSMLETFTQYDIHATWASVGFLFHHDLEHLKSNIPDILPKYAQKNLSPYYYIADNEHLEKNYHFAPDLIQKIYNTPHQEIGSHSFSHYYCLEEGQDQNSFDADLMNAALIAQQANVSLNSFIFPRNQCNPSYLPTLLKNGFTCYRGESSPIIYQTNTTKFEFLKRHLRLIDSYFNISGYQTYSWEKCIQSKPFNFPASRFLRPYSKRLAWLDRYKLKRIKNAMEYAARHNELFHLWWHPHNFGQNIEKNISFLKQILDHFTILKNTYNMQSLNMGELASLADQ